MYNQSIVSHISAFRILTVCSVIFLHACGGGSSAPNSRPSVFDLSKTSGFSLSWIAENMTSCAISNNQNNEIFSLNTFESSTGIVLHDFSSDAEFTLTCINVDGETLTTSATVSSDDVFPQAVGLYGSASNADNSWAAIVNLTSPISYVDRLDFNSQVDSYCAGLGYVGAAKTYSGDFSTHSTYYLQSSDGIIAGSGPSSKVTFIPGNLTFNNVYTNRRNTDSTSGDVGQTTIGNNNSSIIQNTSGPTSGADQMVLCQTDVSIGTPSNIPARLQSINFQDPGPVTKTLTIDTNYSNQASGGAGSGSISYVSSNTDVATVGSDGAVTLVGIGTTNITAIKAADFFFNETEITYVLNVIDPIPVSFQSFAQDTGVTLSWVTTGATLCSVSNSQNSDVITVSPNTFDSGAVLHNLPDGTIFTLSCTGETGNIETASTTTSSGVNNHPETLGYYGSASDFNNSWVAIVNLTTPISYVDRLDFNSQVDSYCTGLGYVGAAKTYSGDFSTHSTYYLQSSDGIIAGSGPSSKVTFIPGDLTFTNVYTNRRNDDTTNGNVGRATIGNNNSTIIQNVSGPTSGVDQMVLCQTSIPIRNTSGLPQSINFVDAGPINKTQGADISFSNIAFGGYGQGSITYQSSDTNIATVDSAGTVTIIGYGSVVITANKASDAFQEAQASYELNIAQAQPINMVSFYKNSNTTLSWVTDNAISCVISNSENSETVAIALSELPTGEFIHNLPVGTTFTLSCVGQTGTSDSLSATATSVDEYPETVGYYGSANHSSNSWVAIVNLTNPINFVSELDFNSQVNSYCQGLGYIGSAKTQLGDFSTNAMSYLSSNSAVVLGGPSKKVTLIPGNYSFSNIYSNGAHSNGVAVSQVTIGNNSSIINQSATSSTSGVDQMVLCQTDIGIQNTAPIHQSMHFDHAGPVNLVLGQHSTFRNVIIDSKGDGVISYESSDQSVATVDANGTVTVIGLGTSTITATKASDFIFAESQISYTLNVTTAQSVNIISFEKLGNSIISWVTDFATSCVISNDVNSLEFNVDSTKLLKGKMLHNLPSDTTFTLVCDGGTGASDSQSVTSVGVNPFSETVGYYGSQSSTDNSWAAIVNLSYPINYIDRIDYNDQVDDYCLSLGYVGAVKTRSGDFSTHSTYYLQSSDGIIAGNGPSSKVTFIPGALTFTNVYTNRRNDDTTNGNVGRATIGNNNSTIIQNVPGPTSGVDQMVLCQTDMRVLDTLSP